MQGGEDEKGLHISSGLAGVSGRWHAIYLRKRFGSLHLFPTRPSLFMHHLQSALKLIATYCSAMLSQNGEHQNSVDLCRNLQLTV